MAAGHEKSTWNNIFSLLYSKTHVFPSVDITLQAAWFLSRMNICPNFSTPLVILKAPTP